MKVKLSKKNWEEMGRKAGWAPANLGEVTDRDMTGAITPQDEEDALFGDDEIVTDEDVFKDGYREGLRQKEMGDNNNGACPYRVDTESGRKRFDMWMKGFNSAFKDINTAT